MRDPDASGCDRHVRRPTESWLVACAGACHGFREVNGSRETAIGIGVTALAILAMAFDHLDLVGDDFPADPAAFFVSSGIVVALAAVVFGVVIPR